MINNPIILNSKIAFLLVPVQLIRQGYDQKFLKQLQLFLFLKFYPAGKIKLSPSTKKDINQAIDIKSNKTLIKRLNWLRDHRFIGYDPDNQRIFCRNWKFIAVTRGIKPGMATKLELKDITNFEVWTFATIIGDIIRRKKRNHRLRFHEKGSNNRIKQSSQVPFGLSVRIISKELNISFAKVVKLKQLAKKKGYLFINSEPLTWIDYPTVLSRLHTDDYIIKVGRSFFTRSHDKFESNLIMNRKK